MFPEQGAARDRSIGEGRNQALALQGQKLPALEFTGVLGRGGLQTGRHQIDEVADLLPQLAPRPDAGRPVNDQRRAHAALVAVVLVPTEGSVLGVAPAGTRTDVRARRADLLEVI